jgi:hypothetical protein
MRLRHDRKVRRAWAALGRDAGTRRLVQLAAACGAAVLARGSGVRDSEACDSGAGAMQWLLSACLDVETGIVPAERREERR